MYQSEWHEPNPQKKTKLIFNPYSGNAKQSAEQLMEVESGLQRSGFLFETYITGPGCNLAGMIHDAFVGAC